MINTLTENAIARIQLYAPTTLNALTLSMGQQLQSQLNHFENDPNIKVVILESLVEKAFSVGIDLKEFHTHNTKNYRQQFLDVWNSVANFPKPIVVKLHGYAMGGGLELALMGDILIADETATFAQPELSVGTIPGMGATQRLPRSIGIYRANQMILTGQRIDAKTAYDWGLISRLVDSSKLDTTVNETAELIAQRSLPTLIAAKQSIQHALLSPLNQGLSVEQTHFLSTFDLADQTEGFQAFLDKRPPNFTDQ